MTTPASTGIDEVMKVPPGVGRGPVIMTSMPIDEMPAQMACSTILPDSRMYLPSTDRPQSAVAVDTSDLAVDLPSCAPPGRGPHDREVPRRKDRREGRARERVARLKGSDLDGGHRLALMKSAGGADVGFPSSTKRKTMPKTRSAMAGS